MAKGFRRLLRKLGGSSTSAHVEANHSAPSSNPRPSSHTDGASSRNSTSLGKSGGATIQPSLIPAVDFAPVLSSPSTLVSSVDAGDPNHFPPTNSARRIAWNGLETSLRVLRDSSDAFPPLKSVVGGLLAIVNVVQAAAANREDYENLSLELRTMAETLTKYTDGFAAMGQTGNIARIFQSIETEISHIDQQQEHGRTRRFLEAPQDGEDVIKRYRRIEALFRQLHTDISLRTWDDARKLREDVLVQKLSPVHDAQFNSSFSTTINRHGCTAKTREKVQKDLQEWVTAMDNTEVYWMNGMAGTGKSTIAYSFCKSLESGQQLGGNFFCSRLSASCNKANSIVPTLAYQLAHYSLAFRSALCAILDEHPDAGKRDVRWQFQKLVQQPLQAVKAAIEEDVVVVIDALDECVDAAAVGLFLDTTLRLSADLPIKFFITSRPEPAIQARMLKHKNAIRLHLHDIEETIVTGDIREYLQEALASMDPGPSPFQLRQLAHRSGKLFIYAATAVRYILPETGSVDSTKRLETVLKPVPTGSTKQYAELNTLYSTILLAAIKNDALEVEEQEDMHRVLKTVICAKEPITVIVIATLLTLSQRQVRFSLDPLQSVLHLQEDDGLVSALHASFPDYMFDESRSNQFYCDRRLYDESLANACFDVMERELRFNICDLESSSFFDDEVQDLADRIEKAISPTLSYSCRHWGEHLQSGVNTTAAHSRLVEFLTKRLLFWMEVLNLLKRMVMGSELLQRASAWLTVAQKDTSEFLADATSFVNRYHTGACSRSTPHIYISRLPFCRKSSSIYRTYWGRTQGLVDARGTALVETAENPPAIWLTGSAVFGIAVSPDGTRIVSSLEDHTIRIWDARTGESVAPPFVGHEDSVTSVAFSLDGGWIASGSDDKTILVWDAHTGEIVAGPFVDRWWIKSIVFSPDSTHVVSGSALSTIRVWDVRSGDPVPGSFSGHTGWINSVAFSPDGLRIASGSADETVRLWDAQTGECVGLPFTGHRGPIHTVAFSLDGTRIISGSFDTTIRVWDARTGDTIAGPFTGHEASVQSVAFSPDGGRILSGSADHTVRVWDSQTGLSVVGPFVGHTGRVTSVSFLPNGRKIVSGSVDETIRVWDTQTGESTAGVFPVHEHDVLSLAFSPDTTCIISGWDNAIRVWDARTGDPVSGPFVGHTAPINTVTFSPDGSWIASGSDDNTIRVWDARTGECLVGPFLGHENHVYSVAFSSDGGRIVSGSYDSTIRVWDARTAQCVGGPFIEHEDPIYSVAFSADGTQIASGSDDGIVRIWNAQTGAPVGAPLTGHEEAVKSVAFSPDGAQIVSGSENSIRVWDARTGEIMAGPFNTDGGWITSIVFSPGGPRVVSGSYDGTLRGWDALTGECIAGPFIGHQEGICSVAVSLDSGRVVSSSFDKSIRVWDLSSNMITPPKHSIVASSHPHDDLGPLSTPASISFTFSSDGWIFYKDIRFLWVPSDFHSHFSPRHSGNVLLIGPEGSVSMDFRNLVIGKTWSDCYILS